MAISAVFLFSDDGRLIFYFIYICLYVCMTSDVGHVGMEIL